jgi:uncharacterized membrane protein
VTPDRFRALISGVLIVGVVISAALIAFGLAASLLVGWDGSLSGSPPTTLANGDFSAVSAAILQLRPIGFAQAGLIVLIATPVVRVLASFVAFTLERDRLYAAITLGVLAILLSSLVFLR